MNNRLIKMKAPESFVGAETYSEQWGRATLSAARTVAVIRPFADQLTEVGWQEVGRSRIKLPTHEEVNFEHDPYLDKIRDDRKNDVLKRRKQIERFSEKQRKLRNWIAIAWAVEWLAKDTGSGVRGPLLKDELVAGYIREFRDALRNDVFTRQINGRPRLRVLHLPLREPISRLDFEDIRHVEGSPFLNEGNHLREFMLQLWVPRSLLLELFKQRRWLIPDWLQPLAHPEIAAAHSEDLTKNRRG
jgi:hypothetical protein